MPCIHNIALNLPCPECDAWIEAKIATVRDCEDLERHERIMRDELKRQGYDSANVGTAMAQIIKEAQHQFPPEATAKPVPLNDPRNRVLGASPASGCGQAPGENHL